MDRKYEVLFQPFNIGKVRIKNRFVMAPMGTGGMVSQQNTFKENAIDYYVERAKGGTGLIITGTVYVENEIEKVENGVMPCPTINTGEFMKTASVMTERVHAYDSKIFLQLTAGFGRVLNPSILEGEAVSASEISSFWDEKLLCRELTREEIQTIVEKTAQSALIAKNAGFDGIEIHAVHEGYLLDQFAIALFNNRKDEYGGDLRGRLKFACDIVKRIKEVVGKDYPVILRYSLKSCIKEIRQGGLPGEKYKELGRDIDEGLEAVKILEEAGYDGFDVDAGTYDSWYWSHPPMYHKKGLYLEYAELVKKVVHVPVIVAGRMEDPQLASSSIIHGKTDAIAIGRGLLADSFIPNKILNDKIERIRPCLGCHQGCMGRLISARPMSCAVNPLVGRERTYNMKPAVEKKKVAVIGGGVAGMEVARVAAMRGHEVSLFEKTDRLGGCLVPGGAPDFKEDDRQLIKWYENELQYAKVKIQFNVEINESNIDMCEEDVIVVATGSMPNKLKLPGDENKEIINAADVLLGREVGEDVAIIGGGLVGCELALHLAKKGKRVSIVEKFNELLSQGAQIQLMNKKMLIDLLKYYGVDIYTNTEVKNICDNYIEVQSCGEKHKIQMDEVISAVGYHSNNELQKSLYKLGKEAYIIGDAKEVKNIMYAIWDGYEIGNNI